MTYQRIALLLLLFAVWGIGGCAVSSLPPVNERPREKIRLSGFSKWERVCESERQRPTFQGAHADTTNAEAAADWAALYKAYSQKSLEEKMRAVQAFFNQWPYKEDSDIWGRDDYWATPREFMEQSGDCEDFVIAKYYALRSMGVAADNLRVAGVWNSRQKQGHAVLIVYVEDRPWVLDNLADEPLPQAGLRHYLPQYYANEEFIWKIPAPSSALSAK